MQDIARVHPCGSCHYELHGQLTPFGLGHDPRRLCAPRDSQVALPTARRTAQERVPISHQPSLLDQPACPRMRIVIGSDDQSWKATPSLYPAPSGMATTWPSCSGRADESSQMTTRRAIAVLAITFIRSVKALGAWSTTSASNSIPRWQPTKQRRSAMVAPAGILEQSTESTIPGS